MKVTFELPPPLVRELRSYIPRGGRSKFVAGLISKRLQTQSNFLEQAARKANKLRQVNGDMKDWQTCGN